MTLIFNNYFRIKTLDSRCGARGNEVRINDGKIELSMSDFCDAVKYVLTNTDLDGPSDPRVELIQAISKLDFVSGFNEGRTRIEIK